MCLTFMSYHGSRDVAKAVGERMAVKRENAESHTKICKDELAEMQRFIELPEPRVSVVAKIGEGIAIYGNLAEL